MAVTRRETRNLPRAAVGLTCAMALLIAAQAFAQQSGAGGGDKSKGWQAVAPGLVEPRSGEIKIFPPVIGRVNEVAVKINDRVSAGEPLIRLDDEDARARVASAEAQAAMRKRARNAQSAGKAADRRKAEDAVADAEAALVAARAAFDRAALARRGGSGAEADVTAARAAWSRAQQDLNLRRTELRSVEAESGTPLPTDNEGELNVARAELRLAQAELEKLTIRAPVAATVLQVNIKVGELAVPAGPQPLLLLGDLSALRVRAEVDEHDVGRLKLGDKVVVRTDALPDRDFAGKVATIAPIIQPGRLVSPELHNLTDFSVAEVMIDLADVGPFVVGMKVDVYFQPSSADR